MKAIYKIKYVMPALLAAVVIALTATACMDGEWDDPQNDNVFGDYTIQERNVITIESLKSKYADYISTSYTYAEITEDIQIKGVVVGNDIGGNIYNEVSIDDGTGAILICIAQGGLFGYLPVGQEILVDLKGLCIGGYGQQAEIGMPYTNARGNTYVSRMSRTLWNQHFKLVGEPDPTAVEAEEFNTSKVSNKDYLTSHSGKLMTLKGVSFTAADGTTRYATDAEKDAANCVNRAITGFKTSNLVVRTSTYADFAALPLPTGKVNITGIFTRYNNIWQILIREESDVVAAE